MQRAPGKVLSFWLEDQGKSCPLLQVSYLSSLFSFPSFPFSCTPAPKRSCVGSSSSIMGSRSLHLWRREAFLSSGRTMSTRVGNPLSLLLRLNTSEEKEINLPLCGLRTGKGHRGGPESPRRVTGEGGKLFMKSWARPHCTRFGPEQCTEAWELKGKDIVHTPDWPWVGALMGQIQIALQKRWKWTDIWTTAYKRLVGTQLGQLPAERKTAKLHWTERTRKISTPLGKDSQQMPMPRWLRWDSEDFTPVITKMVQ